MSYSELIARGGRMLSDAGLEGARRDAATLLCAAAGRDRAALMLHEREFLTDTVIDKYMAYLGRRLKREPVQYIIGEWEFMGLPFAVDQNVLIPRPDTELLVECVTGWLKSTGGGQAPLILDLCTGSGCVAVSLAAAGTGGRRAAAPDNAAALSDDSIISTNNLTAISNNPANSPYNPFTELNISIVATDISAEALRVARLNAEKNGVADRIYFMEGDMFEPFINRSETHPNAAYCHAARSNWTFDAICANPPYIPSGELVGLPEDVRAYEPRIALDGGLDGYKYYKVIAENAASWLKPGGLLAVEAGFGQAGEVKRLFASNGLCGVSVMRDLNGIERVVAARARAGNG